MPSINLGNFLVENCQKVKASEFLVRSKDRLRGMVLEAEIDVLGTNVGLTSSRTGFGGTRIWFACPLCKGRVGVLFKHPLNQSIGCRKCLGLEYRKRRYKGMVENEIG